MIKLENFEVMGWEHAIRGMRNPMNSWEKSDSDLCRNLGCTDDDCPDTCTYKYGIDDCHGWEDSYVIGLNDHELMMKLRNAGTDHRKFMRMIAVYVDITAPLYWWKEFDTYKVGTVANSCSTMHKIAEKEFTFDDFSCEHLPIAYYDGLPTEDMIKTYPNGEMCYYSSKGVFKMTIDMLNKSRERYLETKAKKYWWQMIQLLPTSYNQKRTVMLNYEVLANIYKSRKNHKLDEWRELCAWIEGLPYSELITGDYEVVAEEGNHKIHEAAILATSPEEFAKKLIKIRVDLNTAVIADYKGTYYAACDDTTVEDIVDAINEEMKIGEAKE